MRFACLHTSITNIAVYEQACPPGVALSHFVNADLLKRGSVELTNAIKAETRAELARLNSGVDGVLLTCSTLRPAVQKPAVSADQLLADELGEKGAGKTVEVLFCNPGTAAASTSLFSGVPGIKNLKMRQIPKAWDAFLEGREQDYYALIQDAAEETEADILVLAQSSMAPALAPREGLLSSPTVSLSRLHAMVSADPHALSA